MIKRIALLSSAACLLALAGCNREDIEPAENDEELRTRELPAEIAVRERVAAEERAEQGLVAPEREPAAIDRADTREAEALPGARAAVNAEADVNAAPVGALARRAEADLDTVGKAELDATARFEERPEGVAVLINVEDAKPGTRSVRIYDSESCDDLDEKKLGKPLDTTIKHGSLGSVKIGPSGKGTLETIAPSSTLKDDDRASLLGKTIVVQERSNASSPKAAGDAIACGVIKMDTGLADKAGRMAEPTNQ